MRQIWYELKNPGGEPASAKVHRTWDIGKQLEGLVLDWLENAGIEISRTYHDLYEKGMPYFQGHVDAIWIKDEKPYAILEIKTAKDSNYRLFVNKGLESWSPQYYSQIQTYMGMSGIHLSYVVVLNKDSSEFFDEAVTFDESFYDQLKKKAKMIYEATIEPPRINGSPLWYQCKLCPFNKVCHK
ncbi:MAG TPA: YqaJ viral recombinase family protein [Candidatus Paceibacterota bacterium]|nr:YqaJ viral recombinase family protein [Candidatus Paceibacterota bacterium]